MTYTPMTEGVAGYYDIGLIIQNTKAYEIPTTGSMGILPYRNVGFSLVLVAITGLMITAFYHLVLERKLRANDNKKECTKDGKKRERRFARTRDHPAQWSFQGARWRWCPKQRSEIHGRDAPDRERNDGRLRKAGSVGRGM